MRAAEYSTTLALERVPLVETTLDGEAFETQAPSGGTSSSSYDGPFSHNAVSAVDTEESGSVIAIGECGDPNQDGQITAPDAQWTLQAAVGSRFCPLSRCDVNNSGTTTSADALRVLRRAVGENVVLNCGGNTTTTTTTTTTTAPTFFSTMTWNFSDGCGDGRGMDLRLFDVDNDIIYPSPSQIYTLGSGASGQTQIQCQTGAKICYGAQADGLPLFQWGVGIDGDLGCTGCCAFCTEGATVSRNLVCGQAKWTLQDGCIDGRGIQFRLFDVDNDLVSPPDPGQVWVIESDFDQSAVTVGCLPEALICYGAEPRPPSGAYWGIGIDGDQGCADCCLECPTSGLVQAGHNLVCE